MLCVVGDLVEDVVVHLDSSPGRGTDTAARIERHRGGSAANVAAFAAAAGSAVRFIGRVGADPVGAMITADLAAAGVEVVVQRAGRTGTVVVLVEPGGERTMFPDRGAAIALSGADDTWIDGVTWLHVPGYSLIAEPIATTALGLARSVRAAGGLLSIDVSSVGAVERFGRARFGALLDDICPDVLFANADEARLVDVRPALLVVKHGPEPVVVVWSDGRSVDVDVDPVEGVVDTTGAGDAFAAGFLVSTIAGADPATAARAGSALAGRTLRVAGAALEDPRR